MASEPNFTFTLPKSYLVDGARLFEDAVESKSGKNCSQNYDCERGMAAFLYASILALRPNTVVEIGSSPNEFMHQRGNGSALRPEFHFYRVS